MDELAVLEAAAAAARDGNPKVVLVEGAAGIGKSTLLAQFAAGLADAVVLRASGDEAEQLVPFGIVGQLLANARSVEGSPPGLPTSDLSGAVDPLAVGAELVVWLGQVCHGRGLVLTCIDDLQWADGPSAAGVAVRGAPPAGRSCAGDGVGARGGADPAGEGWPRFVAGDHRAGRIRLGGLGAGMW